MITVNQAIVELQKAAEAGHGNLPIYVTDCRNGCSDELSLSSKYGPTTLNAGDCSGGSLSEEEPGFQYFEATTG